MTSYTHALTQQQVGKLRALLEESGFEFAPKEWTIFFARKNKLSVAVYEKGPKVLVQGKGFEEFVQFELEPKVLGEAKLGYEEVHSPEMFEPHFGVDESGKGDFFGPLVISGVYVDRAIARKLLDAGVVDSKRVSSDARIRALADAIRKTSQGLVEIVLIGPAKYNELYEKFANLNRLLGWGHARVIENLLARKPGCPRSLSDQFADARVIKESLMRHGRRHCAGATAASGIRHRGGGGIDHRARGIHQLARTQRQRTWYAIATRRVTRRERDCKKIGRNGRATSIARSGESPFPHRA